MPDTASDLPTDVAALQAIVLARKAELATAHSSLIEQRFEIEALKARLSKLLRLTFGRSSEKLRVQVEQIELALADIDELLAETGAADVAATEQTIAQDRKPARRPLPETLPRDVIEHAAPCHDQSGACLACGGTLRPLGEDVTEILDYVPGTFRVIRHVRPKLSCRSCETITQAPAPRADSSGRRNGRIVSRTKQLVKRLRRRFPIERLSGPRIEGGCHGCNLLDAVNAKIGAFWEVLA